MSFVIDPATGTPVLQLPTNPSFGYSPGSRLAVPRGLEAMFEYRNLVLHDRRRPDKFRILGIDGFADSDIRDAREDNTAEQGETALNAFYGGKTMTFEGRIECGNIDKLRDMRSDLIDSFDRLTEAPLKILFWDAEDDFLEAQTLTQKWTSEDATGMSAIQNAGLLSSSLVSPNGNYRLIYNEFGRTVIDSEIAVDLQAGSTIGGNFALLGRRVSINQELRLIVNFVSKTLDLYRFTDGTQTVLISKPSSTVGTNGITLNTFLNTANRRMWVVFKLLGNNLYGQLWDRTAHPSGPTADSYPEYEVHYDLGNATQDVIDKHGDGVAGYVGIRLKNSFDDYRAHRFQLTSITPSDVFINCRKNAPITMKEEQKDLRYTRTFLLSLRASNRRFYSNFTERSDFLFPSAITTLGRFYPKTYQSKYSSYMDAEHDLASTSSNVSVENRGNAGGGLRFDLVGPMSDPTITNVRTNQSIKIIGDIPDGVTLKIDLVNNTIKFNDGTSAFHMYSPESDEMDFAEGVNEFSLDVTAFSGVAYMVVKGQSAWK